MLVPGPETSKPVIAFRLPMVPVLPTPSNIPSLSPSTMFSGGANSAFKPIQSSTSCEYFLTSVIASLTYALENESPVDSQGSEASPSGKIDFFFIFDLFARNLYF